jgi:hypothetical protein
MAPEAGFEPATWGLTVPRSTAEEKPNKLCKRTPIEQVDYRVKQLRASIFCRAFGVLAFRKADGGGSADTSINNITLGKSFKTSFDA